MMNNTRWKVDTAGDIADVVTGKVVWFKTGVPTEGCPQLVAAAPEMLDSLRDAVLFMQFLGKRERPLSAEEQEWLNKAASLLTKIEGGGNE